MMYVYLHSKPDGSPFYVGKGSWKRSRMLSNRNNRGHAAIVKAHGAKAIQVELILCKDEQQAFLIEMLAIAFFRLGGIDLCNATEGGEGPSGHKHSLETRRLIQLAAQAKPFTESRCANISQALKGRVGGMQNKRHSEETKEKMRKTHLLQPSSGMTGRKHSNETKLIMSIKALERRAK